MTAKSRRPLKAIALPTLLVAGAMLLSACETVDLNEPGLVQPGPDTKEAAVPSCDVAPGDYKVLAYLQRDNDPAKTARITDVLTKKYASAAMVDGANPVAAVSTWIATQTDLSPVDIEKLAASSCTR